MQREQFEVHADIEDRHWWFLARRRIVRELLRRVVPPAPEACIVDVGCGTGANIAALAGDYACIGIDAAPHAIALAAARFPPARFLKLRFVEEASPENAREALSQASAVLLMDVLEHVEDDFEMFSRIASALRPGAHLLVTVPADMSLWSPHDESFGHYRRYDRGRLLRVWEGLPVTTRLVSHFNARLLPVIRGVRKLTRSRSRAAGAGSTDFFLPSAPVNRLLEAVFAGEARALARALDRPAGAGYSGGASLLAILRREPGESPVRQKPPDVPRDAHGPPRRGESERR
jgi:SAM-dependent methyltransferase